MKLDRYRLSSGVLVALGAIGLSQIVPPTVIETSVALLSGMCLIAAGTLVGFKP